MITAPMEGAQRKKPSPTAPTCKISSAKNGNNATAPPKIQQTDRAWSHSRISLFWKTNRKPAVSLLITPVSSLVAGGNGFFEWRRSTLTQRAQVLHPMYTCGYSKESIHQASNRGTCDWCRFPQRTVPGDCVLIKLARNKLGHEWKHRWR